MNVFRKYTRQSLARSPARTLVTVVGIILSMSLFTAVIEGAYSGLQYLIRRAVELEGAYHGYYIGLSEEQAADIIGNDTALANTAIWQQVGWAVVNADTYGWRYLLVEDVSDNFEELMAVRLTEGRMPENEREILLPQNVNWILSTDTGVEYHVGDVVAFDLGRRVRDGVELGEDEWIRQDIAAKKEEVVDAVERTYTVVGFYTGFSSEVDGDLPGYTALTRGGGTGSCRVFFTMKHPGQFNFYQMTAKPLSVIPHRSLLRYYGVTSSGLTNMFLGLTVFLVLLIAFGSVSLIYNSFSISVGERTRQFGLLRSVGATKKQLKSCVRYEALLLSAVGIPAGLVVGCTGIGITLWALRDYFAAIEMVSTETRMELVLSPAPLALSAAVCLATVLISAGVPAQRAVRLTAIEAIRQSGDIKMKPREVQVSPLTRKWFGFEGMMAAKSFKRDRKRYQATVFSLFLSVTLFISASSLCAYVTGSVDVMTGLTAAADLIYYDNGASLDDPDGTLALLSSAKGVTQASYFDGKYGALWLPTDLLSRELSALEREASRTFNDPFPYGGVYRLNRRAVSYAVLSIAHEYRRIERYGTRGRLRQRQQVEEFAAVDPAFVVDDLALDKRNHRIAAAECKRTYLKKGDKEFPDMFKIKFFQFNTFLFKPHLLEKFGSVEVGRRSGNRTPRQKMGNRQIIAALVEVHPGLHAVPRLELMPEQCRCRNGYRHRPAVVAPTLRKCRTRQRRPALHQRQHFGRRMNDIDLALTAVGQQQRADAVYLEVVVAAVVGRNKELDARITPHGAVVVGRRGCRALLGDIETQHQQFARMKHAERHLRRIGIVVGPVAACHRLRQGLCECAFDSSSVVRIGDGYFANLHICIGFPQK